MSPELLPALACDDVVFAAPRDTDHVLALRAATGEVLWEAELADVVHLVGCVASRLIVASSSGLVALDCRTGDVAWRQPDAGRLGPRGRGVLAGSWVLWPTLDARLPWRAVTLRDGRPQREPDDVPVLPEPHAIDPSLLASLPAGNLAFGHGALVLATGDELIAYLPARLKATHANNTPATPAR
jgi:hypothetical protein